MLLAHQQITAFAAAEQRLEVLFQEKKQSLKRRQNDQGDQRKRLRMQSHQVRKIQRNAMFTVNHQCGNKRFRSIFLI
jgi:hypothetical protein